MRQRQLTALSFTTETFRIVERSGRSVVNEGARPAPLTLQTFDRSKRFPVSCRTFTHVVRQNQRLELVRLWTERIQASRIGKPIFQRTAVNSVQIFNPF